MGLIETKKNWNRKIEHTKSN